MSDALSISGLRKVYTNGFEALKGVSFTVKQGDFFALLGPNGAGKSTTLGIVSSLVNKSAGEVAIFGFDLDQQRAQAKRCLGVVPQEFNFGVFEKVQDIVTTQAGFYGIAAEQALQKSEYYLRKLGLWDKRHVQARMLSGGMKRRLMIARALVHEPKLLILDEPTAGVDIELRHSMWAFLQEINAAGTTIILTTHYLEEAESLCRNIAIIDHGKIVQNSSMRALLQQLNTETFLLDVTAELTTAPLIEGYQVSLHDSSTLQVVVKKQTGLNSLFEQLGQRGIHISSMRNAANRLEALFVDLVEKNLQGGA